MGKVTILPETIKNPITFMGKCAGIAYNSDTTDDAKNYKRGLTCVKDQHFRMLEFCDVFFELDGYSARVTRELFRHVSDGLTAIQRSTRYVKEAGFEYYTPPAIQKGNGEVINTYQDCMKDIQTAYNKLLALGVKQEDAGNLLPLGMHTVVAMKKNARCLSDMAKVRLCKRAYIEYQELMKDIINALREYSEEWNVLADEIFKCKCDIYGYCTEKFGCGKYPKRED